MHLPHMQMATKAGKAVEPLPLSKPRQKGSFTFSLSPSQADRPPQHTSSSPSGQQQASQDTSQERLQPEIARQGSTSTIEDWQCRQAGQKTSAAVKVESSASNGFDSGTPSPSAHEHDSSMHSGNKALEQGSDVKLAARVSQLSLAEEKHAESASGQQQASTRASNDQNTAESAQAMQHRNQPESEGPVSASSSDRRDGLPSTEHDTVALSKHLPARRGLLKAEGSLSQALPISSSLSAFDASEDGYGRRRESIDSGLQPGPVFVPIVLTMDDTDHELLVEEWLLRQVKLPALHALGPPMTLVNMTSI